MRYLCVFGAVIVRSFTGCGVICGCHVGNVRRSLRRFIYGLGMEELKRGLGKCRWAGFGVVKFIRGLEI